VSASLLRASVHELCTTAPRGSTPPRYRPLVGVGRLDLSRGDLGLQDGKI